MSCTKGDFMARLSVKSTYPLPPWGTVKLSEPSKESLPAQDSGTGSEVA